MSFLEPGFVKYRNKDLKKFQKINLSCCFEIKHMTNRKIAILKTLGFIGLFYSVLGVALHGFYKMHLIGHYCDTILFGLNESHLAVFTMTAGLTATIFAIVKSKKRQRNIQPH